jgi:NADPH:quinone reductase-like Zn-dependent oxidoreductase
MVLGPRLSKAGAKQLIGQGMASTAQENLLALNELLATGKVVPVIDKCYPLSETAEALRYLETGRARGKVIVTVRRAE